VSTFKNYFTSFLPISLQELDSVALLNRTEEKFIIPDFWCEEISKNLKLDYKILEIGGDRQFRYNNLHFDTPDNICLEDHIRGRKNRFKVRIRSYSNSKISFLEVKSRNVYGRSSKMRIQRKSEQWDGPLTIEEEQFLGDCVPFASMLSPVLYSSYLRYTIASLHRGERVTFDTELEYTTLKGEKFIPLDGLSIVELKQDEKDRRSSLHKIFRERSDRRAPLGRTIRISKYVLGRLHTNKTLSARAYLESLKELTRASSVAENIT